MLTITTNLTDRQAAFDTPADSVLAAQQDAADQRPDDRIARLFDLGLVDPDANPDDPVSATGNPALWQETPGGPP